MKPLYILKLGGSVITKKDRSGGQLRLSLIRKIAKEIKASLESQSFNLILIHGAGSVGHQLAHKYELAKGANQTKKGWKGSLISRIANQTMDVSISDIFVKNSLPVVSIHTSSVIIQTNGKISHFDLGTIKESLKQNCIPLLYGEMVLDRKLGMTICSGDAIAPYLAKKLGAQKMFFASDIDGVFNQDPHLHRNAKLIKKIRLSDIEKKSKLTHSHSIDTTGGLLGKIKKIKEFKSSEIKSVEIFNGLEPKNYKKALSGKSFNHTFIEI